MKFLELINSTNITGIIAIIAIISPIIVAVINGIIQIIIKKIEYKKEISIKQIDIYYSNKKTAFENFIECAGKYGATFKYTISEKFANFEACTYNVLLFCNSKNKERVSDFFKYAISLRYKEPEKELLVEYGNKLSEISSVLNEELFELRQQIIKK